jgi:release factor glutamine methyltransferase
MSHMNASYRATVYEPAEDSYLFVDAVEADLAAAADDAATPSSPLICLEVGCGSGYVSTHVHMVLQQRAAGSGDCVSVCTDINADAARCTVDTLTRHNVTRYEVVQCNLADAVKSRLAGRVDVLLFNPPYVPCDADEFRCASGIALAWAGGVRGRQVLDRFLPDVGALLAPSGRFYLVAIAQNRPDEIMRMLERQCGLRGEVIARRTAANEQLMVIRFRFEKEIAQRENEKRVELKSETMKEET